MLARHASLFRESLLEKCDALLPALVSLSSHQNSDVKDRGAAAFEAFLEEVKCEVSAQSRLTLSVLLSIVPALFLCLSSSTQVSRCIAEKGKNDSTSKSHFLVIRCSLCSLFHLLHQLSHIPTDCIRSC